MCCVENDLLGQKVIIRVMNSNCYELLGGLNRVAIYSNACFYPFFCLCLSFQGPPSWSKENAHGFVIDVRMEKQEKRLKEIFFA